MPGKAAVVLTAATLSVTVGVLIGIVLIIGNRARQPAAVGDSATATGSSTHLSDDPTSPPPAQLSELSPAQLSSIQLSPVRTAAPTSPATPVALAPPPATGSPRPTAGRSVPTSRPPTRPTAVSRPKPRALPTRPGIVYTTITVAPPTSNFATSSTTSTQATTRSSTNSSPAPTGSRVPRTTSTSAGPDAGNPAAGWPCAALGDKATVAGGSTVFCQHDFSTGLLAWRAVVDGGGCLSKRMTGIGIDGRAYLCRPDATGLDHWRRG